MSDIRWKGEQRTFKKTCLPVNSLYIGFVLTKYPSGEKIKRAAMQGWGCNDITPSPMASCVDIGSLIAANCFTFYLKNF